MTFMTLASGDELDLRYPQQRHLQQPLTIAWHLSQINRFSGACNRPYSVAEHSLVVCEIAERLLHLPPLGLLWALMHDAHEAFVNDQVSPMKHEIGADWAHHESRWQRLVCTTFGLQTARLDHDSAVHQADLMALASERAALLPRTPTPWPVLEGINPVGWVVADLQAPERREHDWEFWRDRWLDRFHELREAIGELQHPVNLHE